MNPLYWLKVLIRTMEAYLRTRLGRYVKPRRYSQIFGEIDKIRPRVIVEVGVWNGKRAEQMIERASRHTPISEIHYIGFDVFETMTDELYKSEVSKHPPTQAEVRGKLEATGAKITLVVGFTNKTMKAFNLDSQADFIFIDGGHEASTVKNDWEWAQKNLARDGVIIFDDYWHNRADGPKVVVDRIDRKKYKVSLMPEVDVFFNPDFGRLAISLAKVTKS